MIAHVRADVRAALIILALLTSAAHACAAEVAILGATSTEAFSDDPVCNVQLSGPIVAGDKKKIENALNTVSQSGDRSGGVTASFTLCLNSPGGSYAEGLQIADFLLERHFKTMIGPSAICYSACALIFMAGNWYFEGQYFPYFMSRGN
jgi:hypothetical protein